MSKTEVETALLTAGESMQVSRATLQLPACTASSPAMATRAGMFRFSRYATELARFEDARRE